MTNRHAVGESLTFREGCVLRGMAAGKSNKEIGAALYLSEDTVKSHGRTLFQKLGVNNRVSAVLEGVVLGVLPCPCLACPRSVAA